MAKKDQAALALTTEEPRTTALAIAQRDAIAGVFEDESELVTGLEETDASDFRLASLVFNFGGLDANGDQIPKNRFFDTISEAVSEKKRVALVVLHKSRVWSEFKQGEGTVRHCASWDGLTGRMANGTERPCAGCPDYDWKMIDGKRTRRCTDVHNVVAIDRESNEPVMIRFKKTSLDPWKTYLNKHFLGKRVVGGKRLSYPLFAFETLLSLKMEKTSSGNAYAVPVFTRGDVLAPEEIREHAESARAFREIYLDRVREVAEAADAREEASSAGDAGFDPDRFSDDGAEASKRF